MLIALLFILGGIVLIVSNPIWGLIPSFLLIVIGLIVGVMAMLGRGASAITVTGPTKACRECRARIPAAATVCRHCGYRYVQP